ncbi:hypothetical protein AAF712_015267 [Marasmius tenuissimus]|uniref:Uncharacterized protein n=1 Tax=Marasmius tenuissimus TaxID=585030 RepID=A0ABR2ZA25_9AGAR
MTTSPLYASVSLAERPHSTTPFVNPEISSHATKQRPAERSQLRSKLKSLHIEEKSRLKKENKLLQEFRKVAKLAIMAQKNTRPIRRTWIDRSRASPASCAIDSSCLHKPSIVATPSAVDACLNTDLKSDAAPPSKPSEFAAPVKVVNAG